MDALQQLIDKHKINLINIVLIGFIVIIVLFGSLIQLIEARLPTCIRQSFRYGKHKLKGKEDAFVSRLEVPKGWFSHFYVFAFAWAALALFLLLKGLILHQEAPECVLVFLDIVAGGPTNRHVQVDTSFALVATVLMTLQCGRRFYETNFVQIFSKQNKINLSHYLVGYIHYFCTVVALLANTEGFVRGTVPSSFSFSKISVLQYVCIFIFHFAWTQQYKSNMILVNLRKDARSGKVVTEGHLLPKGGFFEMVSSPHMLFEVVMYLVLLGLVPKSGTWCLVVIWVLSNQLVTALLTHQWYKENFKNYPTNRDAIIPFIL